MTVTLAKNKKKCQDTSQNWVQTAKSAWILNIKHISKQKRVQVVVTLTQEKMAETLPTPKPNYNQQACIKHSFWGRAEQSLKETTKREPFKLQVWKNSALWIVYSTAGEWGNHAIRPGLEGNCQMIYNPNLANFRTQCWTNTSSHKKWCVAIGSTLRKRACWLI